jgi:hypothetical protein
LFGMAQDVGPEFKPNPTTYWMRIC